MTATTTSMTSRSELLPPGIYRMYIDGEWVDAADGREIPVEDPATEEIVARIPFGGRADTARALAVAAAAMPAWRAMTAFERGAYLRRVADLMRERIEDLARALTLEEGKTLAEARGELAGAAAQFEWYAEEAKRVYGQMIPTHAATKRLWTLRQPVGVVGTLAAWNFPVLLQARKIAPALAAGCTVVARPASGTPLSTMLLFGCIHDAGLPRGTVNLVTGPASEVSAEFVENPVCRKISFTGSTAVGKRLMAAAADQVKKLSLELGGHAPFLVFPDAPVEAAAKLAVTGKFRNMGQVCISPSRFYVHERVFDEFVSAATRLCDGLRIGDGLDASTEVGPLFESERIRRTEQLLDDAVAKGATVVSGGSRPDGARFARGHYYRPTVLTGAASDSRVTCEETFAPIMPVYPFRSTDEALALANDTPYGLAAYAVTNDLRTMVAVTEGLDFGILGINDVVPATAQAPFGGMKESGTGREGGHEGIDAYLETKYVSMGVGIS